MSSVEATARNLVEEHSFRAGLASTITVWRDRVRVVAAGMARLGHFVLADIYNRQGRADAAARGPARRHALEARAEPVPTGTQGRSASADARAGTSSATRTTDTSHGRSPSRREGPAHIPGVARSAARPRALGLDGDGGFTPGSRGTHRISASKVKHEHGQESFSDRFEPTTSRGADHRRARQEPRTGPGHERHVTGRRLRIRPRTCPEGAAKGASGPNAPHSEDRRPREAGRPAASGAPAASPQDRHSEIDGGSGQQPGGTAGSEHAVCRGGATEAVGRGSGGGGEPRQST
jgi:hypothetical protein